MDTRVHNLMSDEKKRQQEGLEMIPSENYASEPVRKALSSFFVNKYSEGYPLKRYYGGNEHVDRLEILAQERAKKLFEVEHVNVQPYSGSPANFAVLFGLLRHGDTIMGLNLPDGGHLTHGWKVSATGTYFNSVPYHVRPDGYFDMKEFARLAKKHRPKLIFCGITAYSRTVHFKKFAEVADSVGAYLVADISHIAGLVVGNAHPSPSRYCHVITTTTHKTLRGPRGAMIMVTKKGLKKDKDLPAKIDRAIFPGLQGGPHDNTTAAIAIALHEASKASFRAYAKKNVTNAQALADALIKHGVNVVTNGTDNHMLLIDLTHNPGSGVLAQEALELIGITVNKNTVPTETSSPFYPSGIRIGTPAVTTRGMGRKEMKLIARWASEVLKIVDEHKLPKKPVERQKYIDSFIASMKRNKEVKFMRKEVKMLCKTFPIPKEVV